MGLRLNNRTKVNTIFETKKLFSKKSENIFFSLITGKIDQSKSKQERTHARTHARVPGSSFDDH